MKGRFVMVLGMFMLSLLLYVDRACISAAKDPIADALALSDKQMGWILSAFALGYALFQVPSGYLADRYGPRKVLTGIVSFWSILTALTGQMNAFVSMLLVRFSFGAGEAGAFPNMSRAIYSWIPLQERGTVIGINFSGSRLGAAFALPLISWLITDYGWRMTFAILGAAGIIWAVLWWVAFKDLPEEHSGLSTDEIDYIKANRQADNTENEGKITTLTARQMLASTNIRSAIMQYFCSNFTFFFALTWLLPHLKTTYNLDAMDASWYAVAPILMGALGNWVSGVLIDRIYAQGKWNLSRKTPAMIGFALAAIGMFGSAYMDTPLGAVIMLSIAIFGADMTLAPSWALCVDVGKKNSGVVSGAMNMAGNIGSFLTALAFPYLLDWTGSVNYFFYTCAILSVFAMYRWTLTKPTAGLAY